jgi:hypothetical protein
VTDAVDCTEAKDFRVPWFFLQRNDVFCVIKTQDQRRLSFHGHSITTKRDRDRDSDREIEIEIEIERKRYGFLHIYALRFDEPHNVWSVHGLHD